MTATQLHPDQNTKTILATVIALLPVTVTPAQSDASGHEFFETKIRPVLIEHCYECHAQDAKKVKGGLLLDTPTPVFTAATVAQRWYRESSMTVCSSPRSLTQILRWKCHPSTGSTIKSSPISAPDRKGRTRPARVDQGRKNHINHRHRGRAQFLGIPTSSAQQSSLFSRRGMAPVRHRSLHLRQPERSQA